MSIRLKRIKDKNLPDMDSIEVCIWYTATGTTIDDAEGAAELYADLREKIKRQEAGLERVRAWIEGGYRDESCEVLESVLEALK